MRFLSCEPRLDAQFVTDEADLFYADPEKWLASHFEVNGPSHIVIFDKLKPKIRSLMSQWNYEECHKIFHAHIAEGRIGHNILIYCRKLLFE